MRLFLTMLTVALAAAPLRGQELVPHEYTAGFRLSAPPDWEVARDVGGMRLVVRSPASGAGDTFRENLNVTLEGLPANVALSWYVAAQLAQLEQGLAGFDLLEPPSDRTVGGRPAKRLVYAHTYSGRPLRVVVYSFVVADRAYVLTGTALAETFDRYLPAFEQIANTFRL